MCPLSVSCCVRRAAARAPVPTAPPRHSLLQPQRAHTRACPAELQQPAAGSRAALPGLFEVGSLGIGLSLFEGVVV